MTQNTPPSPVWMRLAIITLLTAFLVGCGQQMSPEEAATATAVQLTVAPTQTAAAATQVVVQATQAAAAATQAYLDCLPREIDRRVADDQILVLDGGCNNRGFSVIFHNPAGLDAAGNPIYTAFGRIILPGQAYTGEWVNDQGFQSNTAQIPHPINQVTMSQRGGNVAEIDTDADQCRRQSWIYRWTTQEKERYVKGYDEDGYPEYGTRTKTVHHSRTEWKKTDDETYAITVNMGLGDGNRLVLDHNSQDHNATLGACFDIRVTEMGTGATVVIPQEAFTGAPGSPPAETGLFDTVAPYYEGVSLRYATNYWRDDENGNTLGSGSKWVHFVDPRARFDYIVIISAYTHEPIGSPIDVRGMNCDQMNNAIARRLDRLSIGDCRYTPEEATPTPHPAAFNPVEEMFEIIAFRAIGQERGGNVLG